MSEGIELPEGHHQHEDPPLVFQVSITISVMAVLVAGASLLGHRAHTEELLRETQAASRWTQYQSKSNGLHEAHGYADVVRLVAPLNKEVGEQLNEKYAKEVEHYEADKEDVLERQRIWKMSATWRGAKRTVSMAVKPSWKSAW